MTKFRIPRGAILNKNLAEVLPVDLADAEQIQEEIAHSWYQYPDGKDALHPWDGVTEPNYTGPKPPYKHLDEKGAYSWLKAPRWKGNAMEVGPLARMLVGYASGRDDYKEVVSDALGQLEAAGRRRCSRRSAAPRRADSRPSWPCTGCRRSSTTLVANLKAGDSRVADTREWEPATLAAGVQGLRVHRGPARRARHWIAHQERQDRQLPDRGAHHLERVAA